jgi:signal transduction histidine kinase/ActR/RegA family two-component response regulator
MADPPESLPDRASRTMALLSQSQRLAAQMKDHSVELRSRLADLRRWHDGLDQSVNLLAIAARHRSESLASVSHELRTPLNSMLIMASLLADNADGNLSETQVQSASAIHRVGTDLLRIINDFLDMAKIQAGRVEAQPGPVPVAQLVQDAEAAFRPAVEHKGLRLVTEVSPEVPAELYTDEHLVQQVLRNLLANALKFTPSGVISIRVSAAEPVPGTTPEICLAVSDTGIGIAADLHEVIFEPFRQADAGTTRTYGGTGLGLAISRGVAGLLGGLVSVESAPGAGSTFTLRIPAPPQLKALTRPRQAPDIQLPDTQLPDTQLPDTQLPDPQLRWAPAEAGRDHQTLARWRARLPGRLRRGATVLVVDGDIGNVFALAQLLGELGMRVRYAENGREGIVRVERDPDTAVILIDVTAPDTDAYWAIEDIRATPGRDDLPIIALTAPGTRGVTEDPVSRGASAAIPKPVDVDELLEVMCALLDRARAPAGRA